MKKRSFSALDQSVSLLLNLRVASFALLGFALGTASAARADVRVSSEPELQEAVQRAAPGTTIVLANGRYALSQRLHTPRAGQASARITVRAEKFGGASLVSNGHDSAVLIDQSHWTFQGLVVEVSERSIYGFKLEGGGRSAEILDNVIALEPGAAAGIKGAGSPSPPQPDRARIEGNEIYFTGPTTYAFAEGIDAVAVSGWVIRKNVIHGIRTAAGTVAYGAMTKGNSHGTVMEGNLVYDCFIALSFGGGGTDPQWVRDGDTAFEHRGGIMRNNIIAGSDDVGVYLYAAQGAKVYNNTVYGSFKTCGAGCSSIDVRLPGGADIRNNILDKPVLDREGGAHFASSNSILDHPGDDAWFVDARAMNFRLVPGSTPVDHGEALRDVRVDIDGNARPSGGAYDVGANELIVKPRAR